jgi:hypothetical protein
MSHWQPVQSFYRPFALSPNCPPRVSLTFVGLCRRLLTSLNGIDEGLPEREVVVGIAHQPAKKPAIIDATFGVCWYISHAKKASISGMVLASSWADHG